MQTIEHSTKAPAQLHHAMHPDFALHIPLQVAEAMNLNGNVTGVATMQDGMSGNRIIKVDTYDRGSMVIKHGDHRKVGNEITRLKLLEGTPLEPHIPTVLYASHDLGIVAYPHYEGHQLRTGVKTEQITQPDAEKLLDELIDIKTQWWSAQPKEFQPRKYVSMQREEWDDTLAGIGTSLSLLEGKFGVSARDILERPISFSGQTFPPLEHVIAHVGHFLARPPEYVVTAHNDATGANIIHNAADVSWTLLDPEWTGPSDPAEAYTRLIKYITSSTALSAEHDALNVSGERLRVAIDMRFPQAAIALQTRGLQRMDGVSHALHDRTFEDRASHYLAGSYLREAALAPKRGGAPTALFAIVKAAEAMGSR